MRYPRYFRTYAKFLILTLGFTLSTTGCAAPTAEVVIAGERFELELALDPESRTRGLMFREQIAADGGMLFVFPNYAPRNFWMKNCLVDMDILFIDENGVITTVKEMFAEPLKRESETLAEYNRRLPRYGSDGPARFAIELRHGSAARLGVMPGDRVEFDMRPLVAESR
jgi:uncharacterized membrane protein (UPF0127 family)